MRIISRFRDYYDNAQGFGIDPKLIYKRKTQEISLDWNKFHEIKHRELLDATIPLENILKSMPLFDWSWKKTNENIIAFCGKAYPFYLYNKQAYYQFDKLIQAIRNNQNNIERQHARELLETLLKRSKKQARWIRNNKLNIDSWKQFCQETNFNLPDSLHLYFNSPILLYSKYRIIVNPQLNTYNFASEVDPFTAWQEISMYMGSNLVTQMDPEVNIPDVLRAESKGFDKWSFRKHKDENKKRKKGENA